MIPDFDKNGNLPPVGLIRPTIQEFENRFINAENTEIRKKIYDGYRKYCDHLISLKIASIQWVDGSYTSAKPNPGDIDLAIHFDGMALYVDNKLFEMYSKLIDKSVMKKNYKCHPQYILVYPESHPLLYKVYIYQYNHWFKWFSKDRDGNAKGLIEFNIKNKNFESNGSGMGGESRGI